MKALVAGDLRHLLQFLSPVDTNDGFGDVGQSYSPAFTCFGSVRPLSGNELVFAQQLRSEVTHEVVVRGPAIAGAKWRVKVVKTGRILELGPSIDEENQGRRVTYTAWYLGR